MSKHAFTLVVAVVIGLSLLLYLFMYQIRTDEIAVVLTFGEAGEDLPAPGLHVRWPWPIQDVKKFDNRLHIHEGRIEETYTRDRHNIITSLCVGWKIVDAYKFNENFGRADDPTNQAWTEIERYVRNSLLMVLGQHNVYDLVSVKAEELKYENIEDTTRKMASEDARDTYGIEIVLLKIKRLELPESVTQTVYDRMKAERSEEATKISEDGRQKAAVIKAAAESKRDQILALAKAEAEKIEGQGDAEAAKYYQAFAENPELHKYLIQIDAIKKVTNDNTTVIVDTTTPPFNLLTEEPPQPE